MTWNNIKQLLTNMAISGHSPYQGIAHTWVGKHLQSTKVCHEFPSLYKVGTKVELQIRVGWPTCAKIILAEISSGYEAKALKGEFKGITYSLRDVPFKFCDPCPSCGHQHKYDFPARQEVFGYIVENEDNRVDVTPKQELEAWKLYRKWADQQEPKCKFSRKGIANKRETTRRRTLAQMFFLVRFKIRSDEIKELFQQSVGWLSLKQFMAEAGMYAPGFYYEWFFEAVPMSKKLFSKKSVQAFLNSPYHNTSFEKMLSEKRKLLDVKKILNS